jgi:transglutaminase-like putative cysteine protease
MRAIAQFVQRDIRYVAIELGIGGWQAHPAADIFTHKYGDCKDKVTLMSSMLSEIGIESYYVSINTRRGAVTPKNSGIDGLVQS